MKTIRIWTSISACLWAFAPLGCGDDHSPTDADGGSDGDTDTDADGDADGDTDADSGSDADDAVSATEAAQAMKIGWNLGNTLDAPDGETTWNNPLATAALIQTVADLGFGVVRIPVTWSKHMGDAPDYTIDETWMSRVQEVVGYVLDAGLYAIINLHHDGADGYDGVEWIVLGDTTGTVADRFAKVWTQIAERFKDYDNHLVFESMNEIHDGYGTPLPEYFPEINALNQSFVDIVRSSGGGNANRLLLMPGYNTHAEHTISGFVKPTDTAQDKLMVSVHFYDPWSYAGEGSTHVWGAASPGTDSWGQEDWVVDIFGRLKTTFVDAGLPVILGEYGAIQQDGYENYRRYYIEYVTKVAHDDGIVPVYWDNGGMGTGGDAFGLIDRTDNSVAFPEILDAMMRAVTGDYSTDDIVLPEP